MSDMKLGVYIYFKGNCRQAMEFYEQIFGGELSLQTYGDVPAEAVPESITDMSLLMHASLSGGDIELFASDTSNASESAAKIDLALNGSDEPRLREAFKGLSQGGVVHQELTKMFWGDTFGSLTDKFGVNWMVNIDGRASTS